MGSKYWWLTAVILMSGINLDSILIEDTLSEWLLFMWFLSVNFFIYSVCNNGKLLIKRVGNPGYNRKVADFHYSINFLKFIAMIIFILSEVVNDLHDYLAWFVIVILFIDTMLIVIYRNRVTADVA
ncbi:MAG: hypothetical protein NAG76_04735 [Candidatus Pristimantibacillus lignocellulolyticus]|uniref:Uncharacterized protein n=1 Tax=Candidatus Pristimantibacillus lignocellulolyticus TaxID=2994561 RepID=A0A9J6ZH87_9BACL|nr:MAG: hypothetical protein NAG76_04735 [Candidatus Pristimantibacillus lignocellulolyticus]